MCEALSKACMLSNNTHTACFKVAFAKCPMTTEKQELPVCDSLSQQQPSCSVYIQILRRVTFDNLSHKYAESILMFQVYMSIMKFIKLGWQTF